MGDMADGNEQRGCFPVLTRMNQPQPDIVGQVVRLTANWMSWCRQYWPGNIVIQRERSMEVNGTVKGSDRVGQLCD